VATTKQAPRREIPADTDSLEVQARTILSFSRESDPPLTHAKTKTFRCPDPARSWLEVFLCQLAPHQLQEVPASQEPAVSIVRLAAGITLATRPSGRAVWHRPICRLLNDSRAPRSRL
jgi:hypothetical protein